MEEGMRSVLFAVVFVAVVPACAADESSTPESQAPPREATPDDIPNQSSSNGGTPANECGGATSASAVGCGLLDVDGGKYCSDYRTSPSMPGKCLAPLTNGTMTAAIDAVAFEATLVGARHLASDVIEIAGFSAPADTSSEPGEGIRVTIGEIASGSCYSLGFTETRVGPVWFSFANVGSCTFELTDDGKTSGIVTGTFAATVRQSALADASSRNVNGSFSVKLSL
jgi:hypothetical protein